MLDRQFLNDNMKRLGLIEENAQFDKWLKRTRNIGTLGKSFTYSIIINWLTPIAVKLTESKDDDGGWMVVVVVVVIVLFIVGGCGDPFG